MLKLLRRAKAILFGSLSDCIEKESAWQLKDLDNGYLTYSIAIGTIPRTLNPQGVEQQFVTAFDAWNCAGNLPMKFKKVDDGSQLLFITWGSIGNGSDGIIAQTDYPPVEGEVKTVKNMVFNDKLTWIMGASSTSQYDMPSIALHEVGHALGLGHCANSSIIMCGDCITSGPAGGRAAPTPDDCSAMADLYKPETALATFIKKIFKRKVRIGKRAVCYDRTHLKREKKRKSGHFRWLSRFSKV